jgi:hypothetical protein
MEMGTDEIILHPSGEYNTENPKFRQEFGQE